MGDWYGGSNLAAVPKPYPTDGHPDAIDAIEAENFGGEMVERSRRISAGETGLIPPTPRPPQLNRRMLDDYLKAGNLDKEKIACGFRNLMKFRKERCLYPRCRLCMDNCPVDGIDLSVAPPVIAKPCISCEFCGMICPTGAIDDGEYLRASSAADTDMLEAFFFAPLREAEAGGRFRRLVPENEVGTGTPICKAYKHPRWIIGKGLPS
jgi:ferredoxin